MLDGIDSSKFLHARLSSNTMSIISKPFVETLSTTLSADFVRPSQMACTFTLISCIFWSSSITYGTITRAISLHLSHSSPSPHTHHSVTHIGTTRYATPSQRQHPESSSSMGGCGASQYLTRLWNLKPNDSKCLMYPRCTLILSMTRYDTRVSLTSSTYPWPHQLGHNSIIVEVSLSLSIFR